MNISQNSLVEPIALLYCWGKNKDGELSLGHNKAVTIPKPVKGSQNIRIRFLSSGRQHSAFISNDGTLYVCGSALHGKLGIEELTMTSILKLQPINFLKGQKILDVACGDYHTLCLLDNGDVYAWGGSLHKKLGQRSGRPAIIPSLSTKKIIALSCGDFHSAALSQNGELYTWGGGGSYFNRGQLGHGHLKDIETPELVTLLKQGVKKVSCGGYHTLALTLNDEVFSWGSGTYGECGFGEFVDSSSPRLVKIDYEQKGLVFPIIKPKVIDVMAGGHHSLLLTSQGYVYAFGYGSHGQLGLKSTINECEPKLVFSLTNKHVVQIAVGWNHSLALTESLDLYSTGYGSSGQLGLGNNESKTEFTWVSNLAGKRIKKIFAGGNHSWALLDDENPINLDFKPPSPLRMIEKIEGFPNGDKMAIQIDAFNKKIEIHFCDLDMLHRFVKFDLNHDLDQDNVEKYINNYIEELEIKDQEYCKIKFTKFQENPEIILEINEKIVNLQEEPHKKIYTLMMVCDPKIENNSIYEHVNKSNLEGTIIGEKRVLCFDEIKNLPEEKIASQWINLFHEKFNHIFRDIYFIELRPNFS